MKCFVSNRFAAASWRSGTGHRCHCSSLCSFHGLVCHPSCETTTYRRSRHGRGTPQGSQLFLTLAFICNLSFQKSATVPMSFSFIWENLEFRLFACFLSLPFTLENVSISFKALGTSCINMKAIIVHMCCSNRTVLPMVYMTEMVNSFPISFSLLTFFL